jgi:hypothetical protein
VAGRWGEVLELWPEGWLEAVAASIHLKAVAASIHKEATATSEAARLRETLPTTSWVVGLT